MYRGSCTHTVVVLRGLADSAFLYNFAENIEKSVKLTA